MPTCQNCGSSEAIPLPDESGSWGTFCISCLEKSKLCDGCNKIHLTTDVLVVGNQIICRECAGNAVNCAKCGTLHVDGLLHRGKQYCPKCAADFVVCQECGKTHLKINIPDMEKLQYDIHGYVCNPCFTSIKATRTAIPVFQCKVCRKYHTHVTDYEDTPCEAHADSYVLCVCCGKIRHRISGRNHSDNSIGLCQDCECNQRRDWEYCYSCQCYHKMCDMDMENRICKVCTKTKFRCPVCDNLREKATAVTLDDELICSNCSRKCKCTKCGTSTLYSEGGICYQCCDTHKIIHVNNYSYKPKFKLFGKGIHLGVENEIAHVNEAAKKILATVPRSWMFMKSDSSVVNGVECVFHPTTLAYFQANKHIIEESFKNTNLSPHTSAGMHVHMTKDKFGTYQLFKFIQFFKDHKDFIEKVAGRKANSYSQHIVGKPTEIALDAKKNCDGERYRAININNAKTIEVRIFAGVTDINNFMKNIEFCDALYNFTKTCPNFKAGKIALSYFVTYVEQNKHTYPHLYTFLSGTSKKEIPEKYKNKVVTELAEEALTGPFELREGCRVILTSVEDDWEIGLFNPLISTEYATHGTIVRYHHDPDFMETRVLWDNGYHNTYYNHNLTAIS